MRVYSCENPKVVFNKYLGINVVSPCGKCSACLDARAANWVQRLELEQYYHKYTYFVTLQYDEQHVPQMIRMRKEDSDDVCYIDSDSGLIVSYYDDSVSIRSEKDLQYCYDTKVLNVLSVRDIQLFVKKLRDYAKRKYNARLRYYIALEYGPSTFRPHSHGLFFFDSELLSKDFKGLLSLCWQYGNVYDPHPVHGCASSYVASYVNSYTHLPAIYRHREIRPRSLFSKNPPIGDRSLSSGQIAEIFDSSACDIRVFSVSKSKFVDIPIFRYLQDRLFPRIQRFSLLDHLDRVILYRLVDEFRFFLDSEFNPNRQDNPSFCVRDFSRYLIYRYIGWNTNNKCFVRDYFYSVCFTDEQIKLFTSDLKHTNTFNPLWWKDVHFYNDVVKKFNYDSLVRFCRNVMRAYRNSLEFNISLTDCITKIENYYENLQKSQFLNWLLFQIDYFKDHPVTEFLCFDFAFVNAVDGKLPSDLQAWQLFYLNEYHFPLGKDGKYHLSIKYVFDYNDLCLTHEYINWQNTKTKKQNDYLLKNSSKFQNVINYYESNQVI